LCGLAAIGFGAWAARRIAGRTAAMIFAVVTASLPITIAYSRLAWDPCEVPLATMITLYLAWQGRWLAAGAALLASCWIHPTCIFLAPMTAALLLAQPGT